MRSLPTLALLSLLLLSGCLPIPPHHSPFSRGNVPDGVPTWLQLGKSTMADVLFRLGEPDDHSPDDHTLGWLNINRLGGGMLLLGDAAGAGMMVEHFRRLDMRFDKDGLLVKAWMERANCTRGAAVVSGETAPVSEWGGDCLPALRDSE